MGYFQFPVAAETATTSGCERAQLANCIPQPMIQQQQSKMTWRKAFGSPPLPPPPSATSKKAATTTILRRRCRKELRALRNRLWALFECFMAFLDAKLPEQKVPLFLVLYYLCCILYAFCSFCHSTYVYYRS